MSESLPPVGEFGSVFVEFLQAMTLAADAPESPMLAKLREHLGVERAEVPVTLTGFGIAERANLQLALDAVLPERETIGLFNPNMHRMGAGFAHLLMQSGRRAGADQPVEYSDVDLGDGRVVRCIAS